MTSESDPVFSEVKGLVARFAPPGAVIEPGTELAADLNIDSVAAMDLVMEIEDKYDIDVPINQIADMKTLGDLVELVRGQIQGKA
jgi:acyl carrier protein